MRIFLAAFPPAETQRAAHAAIEALRRPGDGVSWVQCENLHCTIRFLGEMGEDGLRRVKEAADEAAATGEPFAAALGGLGAFPNPRRARVLWVGMTEGAEPLTALARALDTSLDRRGWAPEGRAFSAHLTLGRVRQPGPDWSERLSRVALDAAAARFTVDRLCVVERRLSPRGSTYTVVHPAPLSPTRG